MRSALQHPNPIEVSRLAISCLNAKKMTDVIAICGDAVSLERTECNLQHCGRSNATVLAVTNMIRVGVDMV